MARFKTVLEHAVALSRAGRPLRLPELRLVQSVLGDGQGSVERSDLVAASMPKIARTYKYVANLEVCSASVQRWQSALREHALATGQRRGEWRDWGFGGELKKKEANARRKQA